MYEYLIEVMANYQQVYNNNRRANRKGLLCNLNAIEMIELALKYFGVNKEGKYTNNPEEIVSYICPYTGIISYNNLHIDHIIPIIQHGGTCIFNCIPINKAANLSKKDTPNLIDWWTTYKKGQYFDYERLERLIEYILEGYELYLNNNQEEIIDEYTSYSNEESTIEENEDLEISYDSKKVKEKNKEEYISYYQLINSLIEKLSEHKNIQKYKDKLEQLKEKQIFGEIEEEEKIIKIVKEIIKEKSKNNYRSYSMNINYKKLLKSLKTNNYEEELRHRFNIIETLLKEENKTIDSYFDSLTTIEEENLLYIEQITEEKTTLFLNSLILSFESKINKFIEMISKDKYTGYENGKPDNNNIFKKDNIIPFEGYEEISGLNTGLFWYSNSKTIKETIEERIKTLESKEELTEYEKEKIIMFQKAKENIRIYEFSHNYGINLRIEKFIEMISKDKYTGYENGKPDNNNIFKKDNKIPFEGYEEISGLNTGKFWVRNSETIKETIEERIKSLESKEELTEYEKDKLIMFQKAKENIRIYQFANPNKVNKRIEKFIEMISKDEYTSYENGKPDNNNVFKKDNKIPFEGYEEISGLNSRQFWRDNHIKYIIPRLFFTEEYIGSQYDKARDNIMTYLNYVQRQNKRLEFKNIHEYILTLDIRKKEVKELIEIRDKYLQIKEREEEIHRELLNNEKENISRKAG